MLNLEEKMISYYGMMDYILESIQGLWLDPMELTDEKGTKMLVEREWYEANDNPFVMYSYAVNMDEPTYEIVVDGLIYRVVKDLYIAVYEMDEECRAFLERNPDFLKQYSEKWGGDLEYPQVEIIGEIPNKFPAGDQFDWEHPSYYEKAEGSMIAFDKSFRGVTYFDEEGIFSTDPAKLGVEGYGDDD